MAMATRCWRSSMRGRFAHDAQGTVNVASRRGEYGSAGRKTRPPTSDVRSPASRPSRGSGCVSGPRERRTPAPRGLGLRRLPDYFRQTSYDGFRPGGLRRLRSSAANVVRGADLDRRRTFARQARANVVSGPDRGPPYDVCGAEDAPAPLNAMPFTRRVPP